MLETETRSDPDAPPVEDIHLTALDNVQMEYIRLKRIEETAKDFIITADPKDYERLRKYTIGEQNENGN